MEAAEWGLLAAILSGALQLLGYAVYLRAELQGAIRVNITSWTLWAFGSVISIMVYSNAVEDPAKLILPLACAASSVLVVALALRLGTFCKPSYWDGLIASLDIVIVGLLLLEEEARASYGLLLIDTALTFVPIYRSTAANPRQEALLPWTIWTLAYLLLVVTCVLRWEGWPALLLPLLYSFLHAAVALMVLTGNRLHIILGRVHEWLCERAVDHRESE